MKTVFSSCLFGALLFASQAHAQDRELGPRWRQEAEKHGWLLNYQAAQRQARQAGKPLMVVLRCVP